MDIPENWIHSPGIFPYPGNGDNSGENENHWPGARGRGRAQRSNDRSEVCATNLDIHKRSEVPSFSSSLIENFRTPLGKL